MKSLLIPILTIVAVFAIAAAQPPDLPPGHPTTKPQVPPGHPPTQPQIPAGHPQIKPAPTSANPSDLASVEALLEAYYASISGPKGTPRDWERFRSLFVTEARFISLKSMANDMARPFAMTTEQYIEFTKNYFEKGGYFETGIHQESDQYKGIAQVFSTYEARRAEADEPYSRGINSFQMINDGTRWWITTMSWQIEPHEGTPIPPEYLP